MIVARYRKKPTVVDAVRLDGSLQTANEIAEWSDFTVNPMDYDTAYGTCTAMLIRTLEGEMVAYTGDWIIRGVKGEYYPCKPDIFDLTYEVAG